MYGIDLIKKYFSPHADPKFNNEYTENGGFFCGARNSIYDFQTISSEKIKILYRDRSEFRNKPIFENGQEVGHVRLSKPHTIMTRQGSFIISGISKLIKNEPIKKWRWKDVKIKRNFWPWSKKLTVKIDNDNLNLIITCLRITPDSYESKTVSLEDLVKKREAKVSSSSDIQNTEQIKKRTNATENKVNKNDETKNVECKEIPNSTIEIVPQPEEQSQAKYIGYNPLNIFKQTEPYYFPNVFMPKPNCIIKFPRKGKTGRKGFKEESFKDYLIEHFNNFFQIYDDRFVIVKGVNNPYEPDITFIDEKGGKNIFIDIEIDEPYEGINNIELRKPTHYQHADSNRNSAFTNRGWIVIRFAEIQVHTEPLQCCLFIADVIKSINPSFRIADKLLKVQKVSLVKQWTKEEAEQWSKEKYREDYLNLPNGFGFVPNNDQIKKRQETELGNLIEEEVVNDPPFITSNTQGEFNGYSKYDLIQNAISNLTYLSFISDGKPTIVKPIALTDKATFTAFCFVKNMEKEFKLYHITSLSTKKSFYTAELTKETIEVEHVRELIKMAIKYNKFLRIRYTKGAWADLTTGEVVDAKQSLRTISGIGLAKDVLEEDQVNKYNLRNDEHLNAFCNRDEIRKTFRFDRINEITVLNI